MAQWATSFASTFLMVVILEKLFRLGRSPNESFGLAAVGTTLASGALMGAIHLLNGTPNVLLTIAPLVVIAACVYGSYAWGLRVVAMQERPAP